MLLTAGCSFVWGDELDGYDNIPPTHWELTWTHLLAQKLNVDYVNRGVCGAGNDKIFREVTDYLHDPSKERPTHIAVMWSAFQRTEIAEYMPPERDVKISRQDDVTQFSPLRTELIYDKRKRAVMDQWFSDAYDSRTDVMHTLTKMKTLELICEGLDIKLIQGFFHKRCWSNIMSILRNAGLDDGDNIDMVNSSSMVNYKTWLMSSVKNLDNNSRIGAGKGKDLYTLAIENEDLKPHGHPGEKTQPLFADILYKKFIDMD